MQAPIQESTSRGEETVRLLLGYRFGIKKPSSDSLVISGNREGKAAKEFCREQKVFVAGGLTPENVGDAVGTLIPYGVDAASGVETQPGIKDPVLMERFIRAARCAGMENGGGCSETAS